MPESRLFREIDSLSTERKNQRTKDIDISSTEEILRLINDEDRLVPDAVRAEILQIAKAVDIISDAFRNGGRLFYFGAGTSGRLGIVDASECPPTFGSPPEMVQGIIAGGTNAIFKAQEGAEDNPAAGADEIDIRNIAPPDVVCGIAASGRTPFVKGALARAKEKGCFTILVTTIAEEHAQKLGMAANVFICPDVGPEAIAGSTRMKSGTAQKLVLNMLTTASMVKLGKTYGNVMVDLQLTNQKLKERSKRIIMDLCGCDYDRADELLKESGGHVKTALLMQLAGIDAAKAKAELKTNGGFIKKALYNIIK